jgi:hypothetical protein
VVGLLLAVSACQTPQEARQQQSAANQVEHAVLWRGFSHAWGYNHRLNRLGNYVTMAGCQTTPAGQNTQATRRCTGQAVHTAATGTGNDRGDFTSYFSTLRSNDITFTEGNISLRFTGREERLLTDQAVLELPVNASLDASDQHVVFLNGFDLRTRPGSKAKKLKRVHFAIDRQASTDRAENIITFRVRGELNGNCDSMECKSQKNRVRYTADIRWLMLSADSLASTRKAVQRSYRWDKKTELSRDGLEPEPKLLLEGRNGIDAAALGWTEIGVDLGGYRRKSGKPTDRDHWFVEWSTFLPSGSYAPETGQYRVQPELFFKQWNQETRRRKMSIAKRGQVTLGGEVTMIQHPSLQVDHRSVDGQIQWRGKSAAARTEQAVSRRTFSF